MAIVEISIVPVGTGAPSISSHVAQAVSLLVPEKNIAYQLTPMGTVIEGDLDKVLSLVRQMHESVFGESVTRVLTTVTIDDRRDQRATIESKVNSVKKKLRGK